MIFLCVCCYYYFRVKATRIYNRGQKSKKETVAEEEMRIYVMVDVTTD